MSHHKTLLACVAALSLTGAALAQQGAAAGESKGGKRPNQAPAAAASASSSAVESLHTAASLARYGMANKDALSLITAAKIVRNTPTTDSTSQRVSGTPGDAKAKPDMLSADELLKQAREMAAGRPDLLALADDVAKTSSRGATGGPGRKTTVVRSNTTDVYRITFRGNERAAVVASGDGDSDLDLYVHDENGNLICKDDDNTDDVVCQWTPRWTGTFTIRVVNRGVANQYTIAHN
jgi:hypothetical protein